MDLRLGGEIPRWRSTVERSCSHLCSHGADFADVHGCSPVFQIVGRAQDSVIGERWRTCGPGLGVKGSQVQILPSRRKTAGQRPFRTKSEAAAWLPCSHWCSHGTHSHQPIAAENRRTAKRAPWLATWPRTSPVTATEECPSSSETVCSGTPAARMRVGHTPEPARLFFRLVRSVSHPARTHPEARPSCAPPAGADPEWRPRARSSAS